MNKISVTAFATPINIARPFKFFDEFFIFGGMEKWYHSDTSVSTILCEMLNAKDRANVKLTGFEDAQRLKNLYEAAGYVIIFYCFFTIDYTFL